MPFGISIIIVIIGLDDGVGDAEGEYDGDGEHHLTLAAPFEFGCHLSSFDFGNHLS